MRGSNWRVSGDQCADGTMSRIFAGMCVRGGRLAVLVLGLLVAQMAQATLIRANTVVVSGPVIDRKPCDMGGACHRWVRGVGCGDVCDAHACMVLV